MVEIVLKEDEGKKYAGSATGGADVENSRVYCLLPRHHDLLVPWNSATWKKKDI